MSDALIRVLCVDDHPLVLEAVARKVELQRDMEVVAGAENGREAIRLYKKHRPDVTLMDLQLPIVSGLNAIRAIRSEDSNARIIALTMYEGDEQIYRALQAGAATYVLKSARSDDLMKMVRAVYSGGRALPPDVASRLAARNRLCALTAREIEVVNSIAGGMRNKAIAQALKISEDTVETHIRNIFGKLDVTDRTAAVTIALRRGIISLT